MVIPLKILLELKKITASALVKLSKAPRIRSVGAFVLPLLACAKTQVQNFDGLRHYTSGKPCLSSAFSLLSDPKPLKLQAINTPTPTDVKKPT